MKILNIILKILLVLGFAYVIVFEPQITESKGMLYRAPFFILASFGVFIISKLKSLKPYPYDVDILITIPLILDTYGNIFGFFDSFRFYDDIIHMINWICFVMAFHAARFRNVKDTRDAFLLGIGFGAILIILWEILEWFVSVDGVLAVAGLRLSYEDTIGDLVLSSLGGIIGSYLGIATFASKNQLDNTNP